MPRLTRLESYACYPAPPRFFLIQDDVVLGNHDHSAIHPSPTPRCLPDAVVSESSLCVGLLAAEHLNRRKRVVVEGRCRQKGVLRSAFLEMSIEIFPAFVLPA